MRLPLVLAPLAASAALAATGCGNDETPPPDTTTPGPALGSEVKSYPRHGISFRAPAGWNLDDGQAPLVATIATGQATIAIWRYPRSEELPNSQAELKAARDALLTAAKRRDDTFREIKSAPAEIAGKPAVQIRARETIQGQPRVVRSTHVYADGAEVVVDAFAGADDFRRVDAEVFRPLLRSLRLQAPQGAP
ncbi:hypothetical protein [Conexibacter sp. SYSU D00693]|uniref:hypothetical protein n=1 Tax=Conexibacter sp. SYSU D00693 TaxID=2812560 RepID=UPI00196B8932|nr:hypothetical protein [Conexibacter sp. SYSU D00693]